MNLSFCIVVVRYAFSLFVLKVVGAATQEQPVDLAERMKALQTENKPVAGLPTSDRTSGDAGQGPLQSATAAVGEGRPGAAGARPTDIPQGAEGARLERERREAELQFKPKPKGQLGRKFVTCPCSSSVLGFRTLN